MNISRLFAKLALILTLSSVYLAQMKLPGTIIEYPIVYPNASSSKMSMSDMSMMNHKGSTHEITYNENVKGEKALWITGQNDDAVVKFDIESGNMTFYEMPANSRPHGIEFDADGKLWITLEFSGKIVQYDTKPWKLLKEYDVSLKCTTCGTQEIITHPHGLGIASDGTVWYTGKATGTVGKITPSTGKIETFSLPKGVGSVPIYIKEGPDKNMWVTELVGNNIARITPKGEVSEFPIPTNNSRPIAIVPEPSGKAMWFTEEAGNKVARIDMDGNITEFPVPMTKSNVILAGLAFDGERNLWLQQYIDQNNPTPSNPSPPGPDFIVKIDKSILKANPSDISKVPITFYQVPTAKTVMHRIIKGPDGNMWFTELYADRLGKLITGLGK
jgi:virginiamycin B lyase